MDTKLISYIGKFTNSSAWATLQETVEDSPWHREENVATHTLMTMHQYSTRFMLGGGTIENRVAILALLFHDVGKPIAEETVERDDGTTYRRYGGHEQDSATFFIEQYCTDDDLRALLTEPQAMAVRFLIEHHLPYAVKNRQKREALKLAAQQYMWNIGLTLDTFYNVLRSDAAGRISDDHEQKLQNVEDWISEFDALEISDRTFLNGSFKPVMVMLVGPSAAGKDTYTRRRFGDSAVVLSLDDVRLKMYNKHFPNHGLSAKDEYRAAWEFCLQNSAEFDKESAQVFNQLFAAAAETGAPVVINNVNSSKKRRAPFVEMARRHKYRVETVEFWVSKEELLARQQRRPDKEVPEKSVKQQLDAMTSVLLGTESTHHTLIVY